MHSEHLVAVLVRGRHIYSKIRVTVELSTDFIGFIDIFDGVKHRTGEILVSKPHSMQGEELKTGFSHVIMGGLGDGGNFGLCRRIV